MAYTIRRWSLLGGTEGADDALGAARAVVLSVVHSLVQFVVCASAGAIVTRCADTHQIRWSADGPWLRPTAGTALAGVDLTMP
jgi:hypothetical protein